jgi:hypothetical protein
MGFRTFSFKLSCICKDKMPCPLRTRYKKTEAGCQIIKKNDLLRIETAKII